MNSRVLLWMLATLTGPFALVGQATPAAVDSAGIGAAIAAKLVPRPPAKSGSALVIDTSGNRWNAYARRALLMLAPKLLPKLSAEKAYYTYHFTVFSVEIWARFRNRQGRMEGLLQ